MPKPQQILKDVRSNLCLSRPPQTLLSLLAHTLPLRPKISALFEKFSSNFEPNEKLISGWKLRCLCFLKLKQKQVTYVRRLGCGRGKNIAVNYMLNTCLLLCFSHYYTVKVQGSVIWCRYILGLISTRFREWFCLFIGFACFYLKRTFQTTL